MPPRRKGKKGDDVEVKIVFGKRNQYSWNKLVQKLQYEQTSQKNIRGRLERELTEYIRRSAEDRHEYLQGDGKIFKRETRNNAAARFMEAQLRLEDFLFYQNEVNRWKRYGTDNATRPQKEEARKLKKPPMLFAQTGDDGRFEMFHREMLNYYDANNIGTPQYRFRQGKLKDGQAVAGTDPQEILLEPRDLHLFTPVWRHVPAGLRQFSVLQDMERAAQVPLHVRVNEEAIERVRKEWEDKNDETEGVEYATHTERRAAELNRYENTRPSTANILVKTGEDSGQTDEDRFRRIQTASGVFVSALETSHDWLTSYDHLGLVKNCSIPEYFETSAVREEDRFDEAPDEDEDFNARFKPPSDVMDDGNGKQGDPDDEPADELGDELEDMPKVTPKDNSSGRAKETSSETSRTATMNQEVPRGISLKLRSGRKLSHSPPKPKEKPKSTKAGKGVGDERAPAKGKKTVRGKKNKGGNVRGGSRGIKETTVGESWKKVVANIDYPYAKQEFCLPKKTRKVSEGRLITTCWAEGTDGRRERHVGMVYRPSSPVTSPPHSPIDPESVGMYTIPGQDDDLMMGGNAVPSVAMQRRRCKHGNVNCRAWWTHPIDECWIVHEEPTSMPTNRMEIDEPVMFNITKDGRKKYHERLSDHYGRRGVRGIATWPRLGMRVAYEPTTLAEVRHNKTNASLHGWRSLAVPIIEEPLNLENPWNMDRDTIRNVGSGHSTDGDDGESDNEGDLFHKSYEEGSVPNGRSAPMTPPTAAQVNVAPAAGATAESSEAGADTEQT